MGQCWTPACAGVMGEHGLPARPTRGRARRPDYPATAGGVCAALIEGRRKGHNMTSTSDMNATLTTGTLPADAADGDDPWPRCVRCDYVLLGLSGNVCPECGWQIDWTQARLNAEQRRRGTPAFAERGCGRAAAAFKTVGMMLFRPLRFARALRHDEPLWPAALAAGSAFLFLVAWRAAVEGLSRRDLGPLAWYGFGIIACALFNTLLLGTICRDRRAPLNWPKRLRLFLLLSLYSTVFIAAWPFLGPPLISVGTANVLLPFSLHEFPIFARGSDEVPLGRSVMYYWWASVLFVFVCTRTTRIWARVLCLPLIWLSSVVAYYAGSLAYHWWPGNDW